MSSNQQIQGEASNSNAAQPSSASGVASSSTAAYTVYEARTMDQLYNEVRNDDETTRIMDVMSYHYLNMHKQEGYDEICWINLEGNPEDEIANEPCFEIGDIVRLKCHGSPDDDDDADDEDDDNGSIWDDVSKLSSTCYKVIDLSYEADESGVEIKDSSPETPLASSFTAKMSSSPVAKPENDDDDCKKSEVKEEKTEKGKEDLMDSDADAKEAENDNGPDSKSPLDTDEKEKCSKVWLYCLEPFGAHQEFLTADFFWVREYRLVLDAEAMDVCADDNEAVEDNGDSMEGVVETNDKAKGPWFGLWK
ncbi:hypothetical protein PV10_04863 [Exophiala mesophila]|uniref:Uncharacterized protein n=1 Tax=Exophiala mesophila TaxID=212818 RepID=A0A0D2A3T7_EXOME|nr:uncharacterized protein PV10_04863 [Exophiala mesophila]KIV93668.1 hypothetical protein PV10_04863 [Exophiala mesophila]